jgi:hypothetical protein
LTIKNDKSKEEAEVVWANCIGKASQKWTKQFQIKKLPKPDFFKQRFQLGLHKGSRIAYISKEMLGKGWVVKAMKWTDKKSEWRTWFIMDKRTNSVRLFTQRSLALSQAKPHKAKKVGGLVVMREFSKSDKGQMMKVSGHKLKIKGEALCLSTVNHQNKDEIKLNWWNCGAGKATQKWDRKPIYGKYADLCKDTVKNGEKIRVCPGKKDKDLGESCKYQVETRGDQEVLVHKCKETSWEVKTCHRFQKAGSWYRSCGKNHVVKVASGKPKK